MKNKNVTISCRRRRHYPVIFDGKKNYALLRKEGKNWVGLSPDDPVLAEFLPRIPEKGWRDQCRFGHELGLELVAALSRTGHIALFDAGELMGLGGFEALEMRVHGLDAAA